VAGRAAGIRFTGWFLDGPTRLQPGLKIDYASYLRTPARDADCAAHLFGSHIHLVVVNEAHLRAVSAEFARYDNRERPHRTLRLDTPESVARPTVGAIRASPVLGGLCHVYERAA
jgi:hypothetical protein